MHNIDRLNKLARSTAQVVFILLENEKTVEERHFTSLKLQATNDCRLETHIPVSSLLTWVIPSIDTVASLGAAKRGMVPTHTYPGLGVQQQFGRLIPFRHEGNG